MRSSKMKDTLFVLIILFFGTYIAVVVFFLFLRSSPSASLEDQLVFEKEFTVSNLDPIHSLSFEVKSASLYSLEFFSSDYIDWEMYIQNAEKKNLITSDRIQGLGREIIPSLYLEIGHYFLVAKQANRTAGLSSAPKEIQIGLRVKPLTIKTKTTFSDILLRSKVFSQWDDIPTVDKTTTFLSYASPQERGLRQSHFNPLSQLIKKIYRRFSFVENKDFIILKVSNPVKNEESVNLEIFSEKLNFFGIVLRANLDLESQIDGQEPFYSCEELLSRGQTTSQTENKVQCPPFSYALPVNTEEMFLLLFPLSEINTSISLEDSYPLDRQKSWISLQYQSKNIPEEQEPNDSFQKSQDFHAPFLRGKLQDRDDHDLFRVSLNNKKKEAYDHTKPFLLSGEVTSQGGNIALDIYDSDYLLIFHIDQGKENTPELFKNIVFAHAHSVFFLDIYESEKRTSDHEEFSIYYQLHLDISAPKEATSFLDIEPNDSMRVTQGLADHSVEWNALDHFKQGFVNHEGDIDFIPFVPDENAEYHIELSWKDSQHTIPVHIVLLDKYARLLKEINIDKTESASLDVLLEKDSKIWIELVFESTPEELPTFQEYLLKIYHQGSTA